MKERPSCFLFGIVLLFTFLLFPFYFLPFPLRYSAPQSHLHIGLPFGTPIPRLQLEQVMIRLGSFSPTLRVVSFTIAVHEGTTKLFPVWDCFIFHLFAFAVLFSSFSIALLYTPSHLQFGCHSELHFISAGVAGKSLWWIPFRDSCMWYYLLFWSTLTCCHICFVTVVLFLLSHLLLSLNVCMYTVSSVRSQFPRPPCALFLY